MTIVYHGLGYVGLTGAMHFARGGVDVIGYDPDQSVVDAINAGAPKAGEFLAYLGDKRAGGATFIATSNFEDVTGFDTHILAVPSEREGEPWMDLVQEVVGRLISAIPTNSLIIIESTLTPGTIDHIVNRCDPGHRIMGGFVHLAVAPRRDWFADPAKNLATIPRILGAYSEDALERARRVLENVTPAELILTTAYRTAELVKPLENALFHLPIALGHELSLLYHDHDIAEALRLAVTHWRFESFGGLYVGAGTGGRCVPLGPKYLQGGCGGSYLLDAALRVEDSISDQLATLVHEQLAGFSKPDPRVLIMGLAYRPGFADIGFSPGIRLARAIWSQLSFAFGPHTPVVTLHDPVANRAEILGAIGAFGECTILDGELNLGNYDVIVLVTPHEGYRDLPRHTDWISGQVVIDARGMWSAYFEDARVADAVDISYRQIGKPGWRRL